MRKYTVIASLLLSFLFVQSGGHHEAKALPVIKQEPFQTPHYIPLLENPPQIEVKAEMKGNLIIQAHVRDSEYQSFSAFLFYKQSNELGYKMVPMDPTPELSASFWRKYRRGQSGIASSSITLCSRMESSGWSQKRRH